jgi:hypothetical protein
MGTQCDTCKQVVENGYWADNNASGIVQRYCEPCEEHRSEKYGCAMLLSEGATCYEGECGCGGEGTY